MDSKFYSEFNLTVDYSNTLSQAMNLADLNCNDLINESNFPLNSEFFGKIFTFKARIIYSETKVTGPIMTDRIKSLGYFPASIFELLGLAKDYPGLQVHFPIVALGSILNQKNMAPAVSSLGFYEGIRYVAFTSFHDGLYPYYRYLIIK
ncbi:hypothetical protein EOL94_02025 [bacterium]|nr:hypothetical protein [bacterium]